MSTKAFTLMELIVAIAVLAVVAGLAIPNYGSALTKGEQRQLLAHAKVVHAANEIHRANTTAYWNAGGGPTTNVNNISAGLGVDITPTPGYTYRYNAPTATTWSLEIERNGMNWEVEVDQEILSTTNPCCDPNGDPVSVCLSSARCP